jgi:P-type conjugative transfer protein TrbJ
MCIYARINIRKYLLCLTFSVFCVPVTSFGSGDLATEFTQLLTYEEMLNSAITDAENLSINIRKYQIMAANVKHLPTFIKQNAMADLQRLANIVSMGDAISYNSAQLDTLYREAYRDFKHYMKEKGSNDKTGHENLNERYQKWSKVNHDSVLGAMKAAGMQSNQFAEEYADIAKIEHQMQTASGTSQLLQAGGSIAAMQVEQLQKLRQLQMTQIQLQSAYIATSIDRQAKDDADLQKALTPVKGLDPDRKDGGFSWNDSFR